MFLSPSRLRDILVEPDLRVVDARWFMPADPRTGAGEYAAGHIPGAVFFDLDAIADLSTGLPHMLPSPEVFAAEMGRMGISDTDRIVVYDDAGIFSAPRVRWTFRHFGAPEVCVLEGGIAAWKAAGLPVTDVVPTPLPALFDATASDRARSYDDVVAAIADGSTQLVDARSAGRFSGRDPEPRAGLSSGHMPGAFNMPFNELMDGGALKDKAALEALFAGKGIDPARPIICSCGSGVTAAVVALALEAIGAPDVAIFDGSWTEWASTPGAAIVKD